MATLTWALLFVVPYAILTAAGVLLWKRWRSFATFLVALGFPAALVGQVAGLFINLERPLSDGQSTEVNFRFWPPAAGLPSRFRTFSTKTRGASTRSLVDPILPVVNVGYWGS